MKIKIADQPACGRRVFEFGLGPKPIPRKKLNAQNMATAKKRFFGSETNRQRI